MKILKPGKSGSYETAVIACPEQGCNGGIVVWSDGEPYEEPVQDDRERLIKLFNEGKDRTNFIDYLIDNGVTFREG